MWLFPDVYSQFYVICIGKSTQMKTSVAHIPDINSDVTMLTFALLTVVAALGPSTRFLFKSKLCSLV
jgi:hypothetical protein